MRPKLVIATLVAAFGLVVIMLALKGMMTGRGVDNVGGQQVAVDSAAGTPPTEHRGAAVNTNSVAVNPEQSRSNRIAMDLDQIEDLRYQANGANNMTIIPNLMAKVTSPDPEVSLAAVEALKRLDDTNAVVGLQQALEVVHDPREKTAISEVIEYLQLPSIFPTGDYTNAGVAAADAPRRPNAAKRRPAPGRKSAQNNGAPNDGGQQTPQPNPPPAPPQ